MFNIPSQITQGDLVQWSETLTDYDPNTDTLSCFIRGQAAQDLTGVADGTGWNFSIDTSQSATLPAGKYQAQFVVYVNGTKRKALGIAQLNVCASFENLSTLETRSPDEIELEAITQAIAKLASGGVAEYYIGDRRVRYQDLDQLTKRQEYLRRRIAIASGKMKPGGRNIGARFCN
ncbi:MAG: hypothetical protein AAGE96_05405 [Cyanobacteria bacterium P01_G01_bin.19]